MSILLDERTPVVIQGFTGDKGTFHAKEMIAYGTNVVGGVTPGKGRTTHLGRPVFNTVKEAVTATGATASLVLVPAPYCADAIMEAADAGIQLVVTITDGVPAQDMMTVKRYLWRYAKERRTRLIGPNCAGVISAGKAMMGIMPGHIYQRGRVGVVTRSGTLGYEAASQMSALGVGISTSVGIGGDPINGSSFVDMLVLFEQDPETDAVMMIGEIGGPQEADAATFVKEHMKKPVIGYVAGLTAPKGHRMGHAGAIISAFGDTAAEKAEIMRSAGVVVAPSPSGLGTTRRPAVPAHVQPRGESARPGGREHARRAHRRHGRRRGDADADGGAPRRGRRAARPGWSVDRLASHSPVGHEGQRQDARSRRIRPDREGGGAAGAPRVRYAGDLSRPLPARERRGAGAGRGAAAQRGGRHPRSRFRIPALPGHAGDAAPDQRRAPGPDEAHGLPDQHRARRRRRRGGARGCAAGRNDRRGGTGRLRA